MRLLRLLAVSLCVSGLFLLSSFAQTSQASSGQNTSPQLSGDFVNQGYVQWLAAQQKQFHSQRREIPAQDAEPKPFAGDPGIVIKRPNLSSNACGSIVSYNFSPGKNPYLESVTTCTPLSQVLTRRARRYKGKESPGLGLVQTNLVLTSH